MTGKKGYRILVRKDGTVKIEAMGFVGVSCQEDLQKLLNGLKDIGIEANLVEQQKKSEMYATPMTGTELQY